MTTRCCSGFAVLQLYVLQPGARGLDADAADDHAALLWSCCSETVCGPAGGSECWMRTLRMITARGGSRALDEDAADDHACSCGAALLQLYVVQRRGASNGCGRCG